MTTKAGTIIDVSGDVAEVHLDEGAYVDIRSGHVRSGDRHLIERGRRVLCEMNGHRVFDVVLGGLAKKMPKQESSKERHTGQIKRVFADRGFAFILPDNGGKDVFVHFNAFHAAGLPEPTGGECLSYQLEEGRDGREQAASLKLERSSFSVF